MHTSLISSFGVPRAGANRRELSCHNHYPNVSEIAKRYNSLQGCNYGVYYALSDTPKVGGSLQSMPNMNIWLGLGASVLRKVPKSRRERRFPQTSVGPGLAAGTTGPVSQPAEYPLGPFLPLRCPPKDHAVWGNLNLAAK